MRILLFDRIIRQIQMCTIHEPQASGSHIILSSKCRHQAPPPQKWISHRPRYFCNKHISIPIGTKHIIYSTCLHLTGASWNFIPRSILYIFVFAYHRRNNIERMIIHTLWYLLYQEQVRKRHTYRYSCC